MVIIFVVVLLFNTTKDEFTQLSWTLFYALPYHTMQCVFFYSSSFSFLTYNCWCTHNTYTHMWLYTYTCVCQYVCEIRTSLSHSIPCECFCIVHFYCLSYMECSVFNSYSLSCCYCWSYYTTATKHSSYVKYLLFLFCNIMTYF